MLRPISVAMAALKLGGNCRHRWTEGVQAVECDSQKLWVVVWSLYSFLKLMKRVAGDFVGSIRNFLAVKKYKRSSR